MGYRTYNISIIGKHNDIVSLLKNEELRNKLELTDDKYEISCAWGGGSISQFCKSDSEQQVCLNLYELVRHEQAIDFLVEQSSLYDSIYIEVCEYDSHTSPGNSIYLINKGNTVYELRGDSNIYHMQKKDK